MQKSFTPELTKRIMRSLKEVNAAFDELYPGDSLSRQPVHTVYGGAHIFSADVAQKLGRSALAALREYAPSAESFGKAIGLRGKASEQKILYRRIIQKLEEEPVEDFRIDFEDGYGIRPDEEEDRHAEFTAVEMARGMSETLLPPFVGIRIKPVTEEHKARSIRTLDIFVSALLDISGGKLPYNFVVTLPKVTTSEQVAALVNLLEELELRNHLQPGLLKFEIMVETPQSLINNRGECPLFSIVQAGNGRCIAAHLGVYDYAASLDITAGYQTMDNDLSDFARHTMKVALAGTGIWISDSATNVLPVGPHRIGKTGKPLTAKQKEENREAVYGAWRLAFGHITHSLENGYYQGWDLHPAQLPVRYAAVFSFFRSQLAAMSLRLKSFVEKAGQATLIGNTMDDAATGQGLLNFFLRGISCGAISEKEACATGLSIEELQTRSISKILRIRKKLE